MKKEVYTRKPKEAFKRVKKLHEPKTKEGDGSGYKASKNYHENRFKQLRDRKWFKVLSLISTLLLVWFIIEIFIIDDVKYRYDAYLFEKRGIETFYQDNREDIDQLISFVQKRNQKIASIRGSEMRIRSENFYDSLKGRSAKGHHVGYDYHGAMLPFEIIDGNIKFKKHDHFTTFKQYWTLDLKIYQISDLPKSILTHLNTNEDELDQILRFMSRQGFDLKTGNEGLILTFHRYQKPYTLLISDNIDRIKKKSKKGIIQLTDSLYYTKALLKSKVLDKPINNGH